MSFWDKLGDAFDQPAGDQIRWLVGYLMDQQAQAAAEMERREAEKKGQLEENRFMDLIVSMIQPEVLGTTYEADEGPYGGKGGAAEGPYSVMGEAPGGTPAYPEDRTPTEGFLRLLEGAQGDDMDPQGFMYLLNLLNGVGGGMYEPVAPEEPPESVNLQEMALALPMLRGDQGVGYTREPVMQFGEQAGLDLEQEIDAYLSNPEMWNLQFPVPEEHPAEIDPFTLSPGSVRYIQDAEGNLVPIANPSQPSMGSAVSTTSPGWVSPEGFTPNPWYMEPEAGSELTPSQLQMDCSAWMTYRIKNTVNPNVDRFTTRSLVDNPQAYGATQVAGPLQPGDLVVWHTGAGPNGMHVGMAVLDENGNMVVENKSEGTSVRYQDIDPATGMRSGGVQGETVVGMYRFSTAAATETPMREVAEWWASLSQERRRQYSVQFGEVDPAGRGTLDPPEAVKRWAYDDAHAGGAERIDYQSIVDFCLSMTGSGGITEDDMFKMLEDAVAAGHWGEWSFTQADMDRVLALIP